MNPTLARFIGAHDRACERLIAGGFYDTSALAAAIDSTGLGRECITRPDLRNLVEILLQCHGAGIRRPEVGVVLDFAREHDLPVVGDDNPADLVALVNLTASAAHVGYYAGRVVAFCRRKAALHDLHQQWVKLLEEGAADEN